MTITLPFPPSINGYWRSFRGRQILSRKGREFRKQAMGVMRGLSGEFDASARLQVTLTLYPPDRRRRDIDNYSKGVLDAITHAGVWDDDAQVDLLTTKRGRITKDGECAVVIERMPDDQ